MSNTTKKVEKSKLIKWLWIAGVAPFAILIFMLVLTALGTFGRMPSFEELENPKSNLATEIYSEDGKVIGTFFIENRSHVQYNDLFPTDKGDHLQLEGHTVPPIVAALITTEDMRFRGHAGIDIMSLGRVAVKTVGMRNLSQGGGSTISQQLAKNLFPRDTARNQSRVVKNTKLVVSKLKEWITALKLEHNYTKEEIVAMYLNTVDYGSLAFGIKSAALTFFNKSPEQLNIQEAAVLVGVVNAPSRYSPVRNYDRSVTRRNVVLQRMEEAGALTKTQYDSLSQLPITLNYRPISHNSGSATYFREMLRLTLNASAPKRNNYYNEWDYEQAKKQYEENPIYGWCRKNKKADGTNYDIYRDGLKIYTTINSSMQTYAEQSVQKQMETVVQPKMDAQYKRTGRLFNDADRATVNRIINNAMRWSHRYQTMEDAGYSKEQITEAFNKKVPMRVFTFKGVRDTIMTPMDSLLHHKRIMRASMVAIEPGSGAVRAYVGGPNFRYFKYDMAKQGKRQVGSTAKPFVYTFAIDHLGLNPCTPVPNTPVTIETPNGTPWSPKESGNVVYDGVMNPLKWGLARSRNNYSAWIMKQAKQPLAVADFIHKMGVNSFVDPVPALCLGPFESNPYEMTSAFATFANRGVYTEPIFVTRIEDRQGNVLATFTPKSQDAISEETAYTMLSMLEEVVDNGTAGRLNWMYGFKDVAIGGKTGTTDKNRDAWFIGVTPGLAVGAWVGGEDQYMHLLSQGEGSIAALPIVGEFLQKVYNDPQMSSRRTDRFARPVNYRGYDCSSEGETQAGVSGGSSSQDDEFFN